MARKTDRQKIFGGNDVEPACKLCEKGRFSADEQAVLCDKKGIVPLYFSCRKFSYDPLKKRPVWLPKASKHDKDDFSLD